MDILNFIHWITSKRIVKTVDPAKSLLPIGLRDERRDDKYLTVAISVKDFIEQVGIGQTGPQGIQGEQGLQGVQGPQGLTGATGAALTVLGSYIDLAAFLAGAGSSPGLPGEAWLLESDGSLMIWNTATNAWEDVGDLQGPQGIQGIQGVQGIQGIQGVQGIQGPVGPSDGLFAQTANSTPVTGTIVETTLIDAGVGTLTVPANGFQVGNSFSAVLIGHLSCVGTATLHIRIKTASGILLVDTGVMAMNAATAKHWKLDVNFTVRTLGVATVASIASGGLFAYTKNSGLNFEGVNFSIVNNTTFDTTVSNTLVITAQWNTNNPGNSIYTEIFTLNKTY